MEGLTSHDRQHRHQDAFSVALRAAPSAPRALPRPPSSLSYWPYHLQPSFAAFSRSGATETCARRVCLIFSADSERQSRHSSTPALLRGLCALHRGMPHAGLRLARALYARCSPTTASGVALGRKLHVQLASQGLRERARVQLRGEQARCGRGGQNRQGNAYACAHTPCRGVRARGRGGRHAPTEFVTDRIYVANPGK